MTDQEMLKLAAKAGGIDKLESWNSLEDDADAFRLAKDLQIKIWHNNLHEKKLWVTAVLPNTTIVRVTEMFESEKQRLNATCRAITRVAAEYARTMK